MALLAPVCAASATAERRCACIPNIPHRRYVSVPKTPDTKDPDPTAPPASFFPITRVASHRGFVPHRSRGEGGQLIHSLARVEARNQSQRELITLASSLSHSADAIYLVSSCSNEASSPNRPFNAACCAEPTYRTLFLCTSVRTTRRF